MAQLSRLAVTSDEEALFQKQFGDILDYMDVLTHIDVAGIEPLYSPAEHRAQPREDEAVQRQNHGRILSNAPQADADYFIVPRIV